ncbi:hypothetical protein HanIR_Chr13g0618301 [Helianthus annuus]|nr:hypothetical protein HanIR_Chr13g0618301 [Helianthus annuus]
MLRGSLSTHFLHDTGSLLIHFLLSRREDFEDPPTLMTRKDIRDLKTRRSRMIKIETKLQPRGSLLVHLCLYFVCIRSRCKTMSMLVL